MKDTSHAFTCDIHGPFTLLGTSKPMTGSCPTCGAPELCECCEPRPCALFVQVGPGVPWPTLCERCGFRRELHKASRERNHENQGA